jgi:UDP-MurNAc hydroxylase
VRHVRFTVVNHSCLHIETPAGSILVDPWLSGSAYWRSWWHYPPSPPIRPEWLTPDYVYWTHHHFDHLHYPSARRLDKGTTVLIPRFGVDKMAGEVRGLGFADVRELDHGAVVDLGHGVQVASYQYGFDDTAFVVSDGTDVIVNLNDCKIRGRSLRRIVEQFGRPTFAFKSYSFAQCYPIAYTADDPADLEIVHPAANVDDFIGRMRELAPKFAVPFGSMVAFLHPECFDFNEHLVSPFVAKAAADAAGVGGAEVVVLGPGDSWDPDTGFTIDPTDWYTERTDELRALQTSVQDTLDAQAAAESGRRVEWDRFRDYFTRFVDTLPPGIGRLVCKRPIVFRVDSSELPYWVVDAAHRRVFRAAVLPADHADVVHVPEFVLADAIDKALVHFIHISMRIRVELAPGGAGSDLGFWGLVGIWELGYFDRRTRYSRRFAEVAWRRRDEGIGALSALRHRGSFSERMAAQFAESDSPAVSSPR